MSPPTHFVPALGAHLYQTALPSLYSRRQVNNNFSELYLDVGLAGSTHKMAIDTVEDMHRRCHIIKTHLNQKIRTFRRKKFGSLDIQAKNFQITRRETFKSPDRTFRRIESFKVDISAWRCSIVPGINARTALWLPSLDIEFLRVILCSDNIHVVNKFIKCVVINSKKLKYSKMWKRVISCEVSPVVIFL